MTDDDVDRSAAPDPAPAPERPEAPPEPEPSPRRAYEPLETNQLTESDCGEDG